MARKTRLLYSRVTTPLVVVLLGSLSRRTAPEKSFLRISLFASAWFVITGCAEMVLIPVAVPYASYKQTSYESYEAKREASIQSCGDDIVGETEIELRCSSDDAQKISRLKNVYRFHIKWGYSNPSAKPKIDLYGGDFDRGFISARLHQIGGFKVSHKPSTFSGYDPDYIDQDRKDIGIWKMVHRCGVIVAIETHGDEYRGLRFLFYDYRRCQGPYMYPSVVYSIHSLWNKPDWDFEVRAYERTSTLSMVSIMTREVSSTSPRLL